MNDSFQLRDYQRDDIERIREQFASDRRVLYVAPTGAGKTTIFSSIVASSKKYDSRIYIICHRVELIEQISERLLSFDIAHGVIAPEQPHTDDLIQVASIDTLRTRLNKYPTPDMIIVDEAHHSPAKTWNKVLSHYSDALILGVTATPARLDGQGLSSQFDAMIIGPSIQQLIDDSFLSPYRIFAPQPLFSLKGMRINRSGDYSEKQIANLVGQKHVTGSAIRHYSDLTHGGSAIAFCVSVSHAEQVAQQFNEAGISSISIDGSLTKRERKARINKLKSGEIKVLTSCELITEGFDCPSLEVAIMLRPTASLPLWLQMCGRVLRTFEGKTRALILDHVGNTYEHGLPCEHREWSLDVGVVKPERESITALKLCQQCFAIFKRAERCPQCGTNNVTQPKSIREKPGQLSEIDKQEMKLQKLAIRHEKRKELKACKTLEELKQIERARGYKNGWAEIQWYLKNRVHGATPPLHIRGLK